MQTYAKPRFAALYLIDALSYIIPSLSQNELIYCTWSSGLRAQLGYPIAPVLSFRNVFI